jgi:N-acetylglucosamine kinase-like BadF-type ATPase
LASASVDPDRVGGELDRVWQAAARAELPVAIVVSNDVVPLLWAVPALGGEGVVVVCGTGSGFFAADRRGRTARAGGCEYLGSDEGGAVHIGLNGLRAAVRATDGRGPATTLVDAFAAAGGCPVTDLARQLAAEPFPKQRLAGLAAVVCARWLAGDDVAGAVVGAAVEELVVGVRAVRDRVGLPDGFAVAAGGGVLTGCPRLYQEVSGRLRADLAAGSVDLVRDSAAVVLAGLTELLGPAGWPVLPGGLAGRHMWLLADRHR